MASRSGDWIPKDMLLAANLFAGLSWVALLALSAGGTQPGSIPSLAWVHLVALGWLSLASLSVLLHVVPSSLGIPWTSQRLARWSLRAFAVAALLFSGGFWIADRSQIEGGAILTFLALCAYLVSARGVLNRGLGLERRERAIARAFYITLGLFFFVAAIGVAMALALRGRLSPQLLVGWPEAHAVLGIAGWLTLLVMGISARTLRAIAGTGSRVAMAHIAAPSLILLGTLLFAGGAIAGVWWLEVLAIALLCAGALVYVADLLDVLQRREHPNPVPQLFIVASDVWLVGCVALGVAIAAGKPYGAALTYLALAGWLGQMVNGHVLHIGIRLLITWRRGDEEEMRPWLVVNRPAGQTAWALFQLAVAVGTIALLTPEPNALMVAASTIGLCAWLTMLVTVLLAYRQILSGRRQPRPV